MLPISEPNMQVSNHFRDIAARMTGVGAREGTGGGEQEEKQEHRSIGTGAGAGASMLVV